jgi:hypothetical protein
MIEIMLSWPTGLLLKVIDVAEEREREREFTHITKK